MSIRMTLAALALAGAATLSVVAAHAEILDFSYAGPGGDSELDAGQRSDSDFL